jgi:prevent-host-death family protein
MKQMKATDFKANFDKVLKAIESTGEPVLVTKGGKPLVKLVRFESGGAFPNSTKRRLKPGDGRSAQ